MVLQILLVAALGVLTTIVCKGLHDLYHHENYVVTRYTADEEDG